MDIRLCWRTSCWGRCGKWCWSCTSQLLAVTLQCVRDQSKNYYAESKKNAAADCTDANAVADADADEDVDADADEDADANEDVDAVAD